MNQRETIDGIKGEWRTVTKASEVTVGQRVRYKRLNLIMITDRFIKSKKNLCSVSNNKELQKRCCTKLFDGFFDTIQAFFPMADKPAKRKVAKVRIETNNIKWWFIVKVTTELESGTFTTEKGALRGAQRFCKAVGFEMEVEK